MASLINSNLPSAAIALPFSFDDAGSVKTTVNEGKIYMDRVLSLIGTRPGERVMRPGYGSRVTEQVFETIEVAVASIRQDIPTTIGTYLSEITVTRFEVNTVAIGSGDTAIDVEIEFRTPNRQVVSGKIRVGEFDRTGTLIREVTSV